jgi:hypothetical protein
MVNQKIGRHTAMSVSVDLRDLPNIFKVRQKGMLQASQTWERMTSPTMTGLVAQSHSTAIMQVHVTFLKPYQFIVNPIFCSTVFRVNQAIFILGLQCAHHWECRK